jgi:hypothetical protein
MALLFRPCGCCSDGKFFSEAVEPSTLPVACAARWGRSLRMLDVATRHYARVFLGGGLERGKERMPGANHAHRQLGR